QCAPTLLDQYSSICNAPSGTRAKPHARHGMTMQQPAFKPQFGAAILANGITARGEPLALRELPTGELMLDAAIASLDGSVNAAKLLVLGAEANTIQARIDCTGW